MANRINPKYAREWLPATEFLPSVDCEVFIAVHKHTENGGVLKAYSDAGFRLSHHKHGQNIFIKYDVSKDDVIIFKQVDFWMLCPELIIENPTI